jgi:hypothetical protein
MKGKTYQPAQKNLNSLKRMLDEHIATGRMRPSSSEYSLPAFVVSKYTGGVPDLSIDPR